MMKLKDILTNCNLLEIVGEKDVDVVDITFDSRRSVLMPLKAALH